jgi:osmotically-inducible protein OsmY
VGLPVGELPVEEIHLKKRLTRLLAKKVDIKRTKVRIKTFKGIAHVFAFVDSEAERHIVEDVARNAAGSDAMRVHVRVRTEAPRSDVRLAGEILQCFSRCLGLDLSAIVVEVRGGVAHLRGAVPSLYLRHTAESLARGVAGISDVVSDLCVLPASERRPCGQAASVSPLPWRT